MKYMAGFDIGAITATVKADVSNFKQGMQQAKGEVENLKGGMGNLGGLIAGLGAALAGLAIGAAFKDIVDAAAGAQKEMAKFEGLMTATFGKSPEQFREARGAALELSAAFVKLGFDDEETAVAMAKSLAVTKDVTESRKEMALAADFARLADISIGDAQRSLQMAYMGNARVLKQYGIELEDGATKTEIFEKIQAIAGGQAEAFSNTYAGASARFGVEFANLKEKLGEQFLPVLTSVVTQISDFVTKLNETDFSWFTGAIENLMPVIDGLTQTVANVVTQVVAWFNTYLMPFILMLVEFMQAHWSEIQLIITTTWEVISAVIEAAVAIIGAILKVFVAVTQDLWKKHGETIIATLKNMWSVISGIFQVAAGVIMALVSVVTAFITGDWDKAHAQLMKATELAWSGIKNIFNGIIGFISGWGGKVLDNLTRPFRDAWATIENLVNKIKDALDFTKRHSPSVLDIVQRGVRLVNGALDNLNVMPSMNAQLVAQTVANGGQTMSIAAINISLDGAMIGSEAEATTLAERIGDSIIDKLRYSVRL